MFKKITNNLKMGLSKEEILKSLLLSIFENNLSSLEKNSKTHLSLITTSIDLTKSVVTICKNIESQIKEKDNKQEQKSRMSLTKNAKKKNSPNKTQNTIRNSIPIRNKTPLKITRNNNKSLNKNNKILRDNKSNLYSKNQLKSMKKNKSLSNLNGNNNIQSIDLNNSSFNQNLPSKQSINSKSMSSLLKNSGKKKIMKKFHTSSSVSNQRRTINEINVHKKINKNLNFSNNKNSKFQNKTYDEDDLKKILSIESIIQNDLDINNDPLLLFDFSPKGNLINENLLSDTKLIHLHNFNFIPFAEQHLNFILKYLTIYDYMNILMVNKTCKKLVNKQILSNLENEKNEYENKINSFNQEEIIEKIDMSKLVLTKASLKAIKILNETLFNKLFTEFQVPSDDILLIYHIYFQLINHNIIKKNLKKEIFWKKCCEYFSNESNGRTGDLLLKNSKENINLSFENIYKIMHIINGNLQKITPTYFSKIDNTTSLFAFFIKDILDFIGIAYNKKFPGKTYWIYKGIIDVINNKIEKMKKYLDNS